MQIPTAKITMKSAKRGRVFYAIVLRLLQVRVSSGRAAIITRRISTSAPACLVGPSHLQEFEDQLSHKAASLSGDGSYSASEGGTGRGAGGAAG